MKKFLSNIILLNIILLTLSGCVIVGKKTTSLSLVYGFMVIFSLLFLDIYYKDVTIETINSITVLNKEYGPWHCLYFFYLLIYFSIMTATILYAKTLRNFDSHVHAIILLIAVFVNIGVWFLEQLVNIDFEFLSVSYIISELFLLGVQTRIQNQVRLRSIKY